MSAPAGLFGHGRGRPRQPGYLGTEEDVRASRSYRAGARTRNLGWRIDYNMTSNSLREKLLNARILPEAVHSDHCPVLLELDL
ncbi:hypothetical protein DSECCO2_344560 [anaerobic digester metagenome]